MLGRILQQCMALTSAITLGWAGSTVADEGESPSGIETRVFDIRPLLLEVPDYRATFSDLRSDDLYGPPVGPAVSDPNFEAPSQATPARATADTRRENAEIILEMIRDVVDPYSWIDRGGDVGSIRFFAGQLVVSQTAENLARIEHLLDLLKAARTATVGLEAYFVQVPAAARERRELGDLGVRQDLTEADFQGLLATGQEVITVTRASLSGFDGQRVFTTAGQQINIVVGVNAVVAQASSEVQPVVRQLLSGVTLESQPVIDHERNVILLDLRASIAEVEAEEEPKGPVDNSLAAGTAAPPYRVAHFAASLSVPVDRVSLVSAVPYDQERDVLLFVRATVK